MADSPDSIDRPSSIDRAWDIGPPVESVKPAGPDPVKRFEAAETLLAEGHLEDAWEAAEQARAGFTKDDPLAEAEALYLLACIASERGFALVGQERLTRAIALRTERAEGVVPIVWYELRASLAMASGDLDTALTAWETAAALARGVRDATGEGTDRLCVALRGLGDVHLAHGDRLRARAVFTALAEEAHALAAASGDPHALRHVTSALQRLGDACHEDGDLPATITAYREAVREAKRAAVTTGDSTEALWDLSVGLNRLGSAQLEADQAQAAIASFEQSVELRRDLARRLGRSPQALSGLASSLSKLGAALQSDGDAAAASTAIAEAAALDEEAALDDDNHPLTLVPPPGIE